MHFKNDFHRLQQVTLFIVALLILSATRPMLAINAQTIEYTDDIDIRRHADSSATIYDFVFADSEFESSGFSHTDPEVQNIYENAVTEMQSLHQYDFQDPLFILNPYGTVTNGLYVYFEVETPGEINYRITTEGNHQSHVFERTLRNASQNSSQFEGQLIGLVPGLHNEVLIELFNEDGEVIDTFEFDIQMPKTKSFYPNNMLIEDGNSSVPLSDGLFYLVGTNQFNGFTYFFDNDGILRAELETSSYRFDNLLFFNHQILVPNTSRQFILMDSLGKVTAYYDLPGYNMHHDFIEGKEGEILILASIFDSTTIRREDIILSLSLATGEVTEVLDLTTILPDYLSLTTPAYDANGNANDLDWIHINSIEKVSEDEVVLSSRETSTIIKVSDLYTQPQLDYLIGPESVWAETSYSELLLEAENDFPIQGGQHSLNYSSSPLLRDGQYYLTFYNNNYWRYLTRPDFMGAIDEEISHNFEPNPDDNSYFYKYLIDEDQGSVELVQSFAVPYSSIVSNVDPQPNRNYVINSGKSNVVGEYDNKGNLIQAYHYTSASFTYRAFKDDFNGFWFAE